METESLLSFPGRQYFPGIIKCILYDFKGTAAAAAKSLQSCPTLGDPTDGSSPDSAVPGILQARTLDWVAISFSIKGTRLLELVPGFLRTLFHVSFLFITFPCILSAAINIYE